MTVDYSHNTKYAQNGLTNPIVSRCVCGHVLEWHYALGRSEKDGSTGFLFRSPHANRCPSNTCECSQPQWDGKEPAKLPNLLVQRDAASPAA